MNTSHVIYYHCIMRLAKETSQAISIKSDFISCWSHILVVESFHTKLAHLNILCLEVFSFTNNHIAITRGIYFLKDYNTKKR